MTGDYEHMWTTDPELLPTLFRMSDEYHQLVKRMRPLPGNQLYAYDPYWTVQDRVSMWLIQFVSPRGTIALQQIGSTGYARIAFKNMTARLQATLPVRPT